VALPQDCGTPHDLQAHHLRSRSHLGDDAEENLITLCAGCHRARHLHRQTHHRAGWDSLSASGADPFANSGLMLLAIELFSWVSKLNERSRVLAQQLAILRDSLDREIASRKSGNALSPQES